MTRKIDKSRVKHILVITLSNVGDVILTTPVVEALLKEFPQSKVDIVVGPNGKEVFEYHKKLSDITIYDKKSTVMGKISFFLRLRKKKYDLVVDLKNTILPFVLTPIYRTAPLKRSAETGMHKKDAHLARLTTLGIDISGEKFFIPIEESDREYVNKLLEELKEKPFIAVSPGAKSHVKRWPLKNFVSLCDMIKNNLDYEVVLVGDENDRIVIERMLFYMKTRPLNLIEKTNIHQLAYLIGKSALLITNDSAPLHVGSAVDARILAFFGPTDAKKYGPFTRNASKVLQRDIKCAPCEVPQCINNDNKYECLKAVSVEEAFEAVKELIR